MTRDDALRGLRTGLLELLWQKMRSQRPGLRAAAPEPAGQLARLRAADAMAEIGEPRDSCQGREAGQRWSSGQAEFVLMECDKANGSPLWRVRCLTSQAGDTWVSDIALRTYWVRVS